MTFWIELLIAWAGITLAIFVWMLVAWWRDSRVERRASLRLVQRFRRDEGEYAGTDRRNAERRRRPSG